MRLRFILPWTSTKKTCDVEQKLKTQLRSKRGTRVALREMTDDCQRTQLIRRARAKRSWKQAMAALQAAAPDGCIISLKNNSFRHRRELLQRTRLFRLDCYCRYLRSSLRICLRIDYVAGKAQRSMTG